MTVTLRFAPSPTGFLHIGGARKALFNYLYAKKHEGRFLLRIEDTDLKRSTKEAIDAIHEGMQWLGLDADEPPVMQSMQRERHQAVVEQLLESGAAYRCYMSAEELAEARATAQAKGEVYRYDRRWRDRPADDVPEGIEPSIRLKAPLEGSVVIEDQVQGRVEVACSELDDMVIMRSDGTPTYPLAVVVDDHDMGITHILRGDDHLTNSFRQALIYQALGWALPAMAHIPLIHGSDGAKLSKRHGALGVMEYQAMGYLPQAMRNYLLRLGWSHGDDEMIDDAQAIEWFDLGGIGASPARFDMDKLDHINAHYLRALPHHRIMPLATPFMEHALGQTLDDQLAARFERVMPEVQARAVTLVDLAESALFYFRAPKTYSEKAHNLITKHHEVLVQIYDHLHALNDWDQASIMAHCEAYAAQRGLKLGKIMNPIRAAITGSHASPSMFGVMEELGKDESLARIERAKAEGQDA